MRNGDGNARQFTLDLGRDPSYEPDQFLVSPSNARAHAMIDRWPHWPARMLLLQGPTGSGKSHLGAIWCERAQAVTVRPRDASGLCALLTTRVVGQSVLLEDCDRAGHDENALFHLINAIGEVGGWLLVTARCPPEAWGIETRDLLSRLRAAPTMTIDAPDTTLLKAVLVKLFADRQIRVEEDVVSYAALHCDQSLEAISAFVSMIDDEGLASGRRINRPLATQIISRLASGGPLEEIDR